MVDGKSQSQSFIPTRAYFWLLAFLFLELSGKCI
jgi:hypothetical protein